MKTKAETNSDSRNKYLFLLYGMSLLFIFGAIAVLSRQFVFGLRHAERPVIGFILLMSAAFLIYVWVLLFFMKGRCQIRTTVIIGFALLFRVLFFFSNPIQENDFYRYLWDGRVMAAGINPYLVAPDDIDDVKNQTALIIKLRNLRDSDPYLKETVFPRIGHSEVNTIYPPVAQAIFAVVGVLKGKTTMLRTVLLVFDLACMLLIVLLLRQLKLPEWAVVIYAWSPIIIKEFANAMHMDVIPIAFMLAALLLAIKERWISAIASLAVATLSKFFPILLLPFFLKRFWTRRPAQAFYAACIFGIVVAAGFIPFLENSLSAFSGLLTYARDWQVNAPVFSALSMLSTLMIGAHNSQLLARILSGILISMVALTCMLRQKDTPETIVQTSLITMSALFLIGATGYPWYFAWVLCLCAVLPSRALILCSGLVPLYYLRFYYAYRGNAEFFQDVIIWLEFAPVYALLIWDMFFRKNLLIKMQWLSL